MLELLATVDPMQTLMGMLWLFAAGMFPAGMMLGSQCSACCNPCSLCTEGTLPETITVTFDGLTDKTKGPDLISVGFSSCYGTGAAARVTAPGGDPDTDKGPIGTVSLTNAGSGYAKLGRVAPTITASGGSGSGATLTATTTKSQDACNVDYWKVSSVSVSGGTGYADGDAVTFSVATGDTEEQAASATIHTTRTEPTLTASAPGGSGATFTLSYTASLGSPSTWAVSGVTVTNGGTGYSGGSYLTFTPGSGDKTTDTAYAVIVTNRAEPTLSASVTSSTGSGASLAVTLSSSSGYDGTEWSVSALTISGGGSGYAEGDQVAITVIDGQASMWSYFDAAVSAVDGSGTITAITINYGGAYYKDEGIIQSVTIYWGGAYYKDDGVPTSVSVEAGGIYYREDSTATPYVATVTVSLTQEPPSAGSGASITATVEDDTGSANFGKIVALTIANGGNDYLAWKWISNACCGWQLNGKPIVLHRGHLPNGDFLPNGGAEYVDSKCIFSHEMCGGWGPGSTSVMSLRVYYRGPTNPPCVAVVPWNKNSDVAANACATFLCSEDLVTDCSSLSFTATNLDGISASVTSGGDYDPTYKNPAGTYPNTNQWGSCTPCCHGHESIPGEIEVDVVDRGYYGGESMSGTYVLALNFYGGLYWAGGRGCLDPLCTQRFNMSIGINPGDCQSPSGCDNCIKKCAISASCAMEFRPAVWWNPDDRDMRLCFYDDPTLDDAGRLAAYCTNLCYETPLCRPPSGMEFSFYKPSGSDNFDQFGCPNCCDENTVNPDHLNTFTMTVV